MFPDRTLGARSSRTYCRGSERTGDFHGDPGIPSLANVEAAGSEPHFPSGSLAAELPESVLVPLVNQFGLMQQQMFDQFQQAMAMMVQMFGTMHRDQMAVIREELDRLHDITDEFHALKTELATRTHDQSTTPSSGPVITARDRGRPHQNRSLFRHEWWLPKDPAA